MADPFEVRMRFTSQLQHLNASTASALKAANFAIRHAEFSDDLHSCILEQLERNNMNNRANIMYFLPSLCDVAKAHGDLGYVRMIERDILRIIDLVAPDDGSGAANAKVVRKVLQQLREKAFLRAETVVELEECLAGRESAHHHGQPASPGGFPKPAFPLTSEGGSAGGAGVGGTAGAAAAAAAAAAGGAVVGVAGVPGGVTGAGGVITPAMRSTPQSTSRDATGHFHHPGIRLDKRQIEQRIEEDRERHKRAREGIWAIPQRSTDLADDAEFDKLWAELGPADEDDMQKAKEEAEERAKHLQFDEY